MTEARRLLESDTTSLRACLEREPEINLFLLACMAHSPISQARWFGVFQGPSLEAVAQVIPDRVVVPWSAHADAARHLGRHLREQGCPPSLLVGPRETSDALWEGWTHHQHPQRWHNQRLYVARNVTPVQSPHGFRPATVRDLPTVARFSALMTLEDMGDDPYSRDPASHESSVRARIEDGRVFVIAKGDQILFQMHIGTEGPHGCQIAGTYVPPEYRGQGLATQGVAEVTRRALRKHALVTLHVNEANTPAVRAYEKVGFHAFAPFRLAMP
jgi:predicted GNAT family acetyltransferase